MRLKVLAVGLGLLLSCAALADEPATTTETPQAAPPPLSPEVLATIPSASCDKPRIPERASMPDEDVRYFLDKVQVYTDCVTAFIQQRQVDMRHFNDLARAHAESGNDAARGINEYHVKVREFMDKHAPKKK